jgi:hypothetical protein
VTWFAPASAASVEAFADVGRTVVAPPCQRTVGKILGGQRGRRSEAARNKTPDNWRTLPANRSASAPLVIADRQRTIPLADRRPATAGKRWTSLLRSVRREHHLKTSRRQPPI